MARDSDRRACAVRRVHTGAQAWLRGRTRPVSAAQGRTAAAHHACPARGPLPLLVPSAVDGQGPLMRALTGLLPRTRRGCGGQRPRDAVIRELEEETGPVAGNVHLLAVIDPLPAVAAARMHLFLATDLRTGTQRRDDTEIAWPCTGGCWRRPSRRSAPD
ncbi:NUDIX domain-containing protein [Streptomyces sp. UG1]|uniref:NUDIX domain-containing protein n=1 Tax=Streptomyces sp. UG1 TaxID=3417652 RepID=UPI003CEADE5A